MHAPQPVGSVICYSLLIQSSVTACWVCHLLQPADSVICYSLLIQLSATAGPLITLSLGVPALAFSGPACGRWRHAERSGVPLCHRGSSVAGQP